MLDCSFYPTGAKRGFRHVFQGRHQKLLTGVKIHWMIKGTHFQNRKWHNLDCTRWQTAEAPWQSTTSTVFSLIHCRSSHQKQLSCPGVCVSMLRVCALSPAVHCQSFLKTNCRSSGWAGKAASAVGFCAMLSSLNGTHQMPYLFNLWLSGLGKKGGGGERERRLVFQNQNVNHKPSLVRVYPRCILSLLAQPGFWNLPTSCLIF